MSLAPFVLLSANHAGRLSLTLGYVDIPTLPESPDNSTIVYIHELTRNGIYLSLGDIVISPLVHYLPPHPGYASLARCRTI